MNDLHPDFLPTWTNIVRHWFDLHPGQTLDVADEYEGKPISWFQGETCFMGEAFNWSAGWDDNGCKDCSNFGYGQSRFCSFNDFLSFKNQIYDHLHSNIHRERVLQFVEDKLNG